MGLRCLVGHDYGDARTSRDQRARGNEVVVTVREYRECARCGHQRIISENKEIKVGTPAEPAGEASDDQPGSVGAPAAGEEPGAASRAGGDALEPMTAEEDDGIILEDEPEGPTRAHGEWPDDSRGTAVDEPAGADAEPGEEGSAGVEFGGSLAPEDIDPTTDDGSTDDGSTDAGVTDAEAPGDDAEIIDADAEAAADAGATQPTAPTGGTDGPESGEDGPASAGEPLRPRPDDRHTEFVCTECGETWPAVNASLRPGDICPECRRGYLTEQVAQ